MGSIKILPKTTSDYLLINDYIFSNSLYRLKNILILKNPPTLFRTLHFVTTTLEDIEEAFIYRDIPIRNLKRCTKADGKAMTLVTFSLVDNSDRSKLLKGCVNNKQPEKMP